MGIEYETIHHLSRLSASQRQDIFNRINSLSPDQARVLDAWVTDYLSDYDFCKDSEISLTKPSREQVQLVKAYVFSNFFSDLNQ